MNDKLEELITEYLSDTLDPDARLHFEQRIAADPELAARVALELDLANALGANSPENQLRANLRHISDKYDSVESLDPISDSASNGSTRSWWILAAALLLCGALLFWSLYQREKEAIPLSRQPNLELPNTAPTEAAPKINEAEKPKTPNKNQPVAAAFKPISQLESFIGSQVRSGSFRFRVEEPASGMTLPLHSGQALFRLSGRIEGAVPTVSMFNVLIFSNNLPRFESMRPVESQPLVPNPGGEFLFQKNLELLPGLYYLLIEERSSGEWLFVDKFLVK